MAYQFKCVCLVTHFDYELKAYSIMCITLSFTHFGGMDLSFRKWREVENNAQYDESYQLQLDRLLHCLQEKLDQTTVWYVW